MISLFTASGLGRGFSETVFYFMLTVCCLKLLIMFKTLLQPL